MGLVSLDRSHNIDNWKLLQLVSSIPKLKDKTVIDDILSTLEVQQVKPTQPESIPYSSLLINGRFYNWYTSDK